MRSLQQLCAGSQSLATQDSGYLGFVHPQSFT